MKNKSFRSEIKDLLVTNTDFGEALEEILEAVLAMAKRVRPEDKPEVSIHIRPQALDDYLEAIEKECG